MNTLLMVDPDDGSAWQVFLLNNKVVWTNALPDDSALQTFTLYDTTAQSNVTFRMQAGSLQWSLGGDAPPSVIQIYDYGTEQHVQLQISNLVLGWTPLINTLSMVDWVDSFYLYVKRRVQQRNPSRKFGGVVQARAWPLKDADFETYYLLLGELTPGGISFDSWFSPSYQNKIQWVWTIKGTDVPQGVIQANGGDRYLTYYAMTQEILYGMFPGFCEKQTWNVQNAAFVGTSYDPPAFIRFGKPSFVDRYDAAKGILTGGASSSITGFSPVLQ